MWKFQVCNWFAEMGFFNQFPAKALFLQEQGLKLSDQWPGGGGWKAPTYPLLQVGQHFSSKPLIPRWSAH